jgi:hypothetical protein
VISLEKATSWATKFLVRLTLLKDGVHLLHFQLMIAMAEGSVWKQDETGACEE